jgi:oligopeptide transport system permease protein
VVSRPLVIIAIIALAALFVPPLLPWAYDQIDWDAVRAAPFSVAHPAGSDSVGRDVLARTLVGTRITLGVALAAKPTNS